MQIKAHLSSNTLSTNVGAKINVIPETDYDNLKNKPTINGRTLEGSFTLDALDVGAVPIVTKLTNKQIEEIIKGV